MVTAPEVVELRLGPMLTVAKSPHVVAAMLPDTVTAPPASSRLASLPLAGPASAAAVDGAGERAARLDDQHVGGGLLTGRPGRWSPWMVPKLVTLPGPTM